MPRHRLTDEQWDLICDLFPPRKRTGRPPRNRRVVLDAILWVLRTGAGWRDVPEEYGPWSTAWDLFNKWTSDGTLDAILNRLRAVEVDLGNVNMDLWCIDGTIVRAARCAGGGGKKTTQPSRKTMPWVAREAVSRRKSTSSATATDAR